ncbi:MAG: tyrosine-type recombinase/integrase [Rubrivivax sp.]|nr:tyrosine-type recombinase/integrase [Rubrivivax sp.]
MKASAGDYSDGGGLALRVSESGASWVLRYTAPSGRRREMGLGQVHRASLAQAGDSLTTARALAHDARELLRRGSDPLEQRDEARRAARQADQAKKAEQARERWTLMRCGRDYHERIIEPNRTRKHAAQWIASLENHVPSALWRAPIDTVTAPALLQALQGATAHLRPRNHRDLGETLRRVRQRLDAVFEDAEFFGRCSGNPAAAIKRKLMQARPMKAGRFAALDYREAPALLARLRAMPGTAARCLEFAVITAARTSEAMLAEWSEFNLAEAVQTVPAERMKACEAHTVFLSPRALALLEAQRGQDARFVFPSSMPGRTGKPMSNMALLAVLKRLGVRDRTTVHGLCRATFSTWANDTGAARPDVIEACLAHEEGNRVRAAYNRATFAAERRALLAAWGEYLARPALVLAA